MPAFLKNKWLWIGLVLIAAIVSAVIVSIVYQLKDSNFKLDRELKELSLL